MREKNEGRWVGGGGSVRMRDGLVRTRDGSMVVGRRSTLRMKDGLAEDEDKGWVDEDEGWVGGVGWVGRVPFPCST